MKRFLAIVLAGVMLLSLVACGEKKDENVVKIGVLDGNGVEIVSDPEAKDLPKFDGAKTIKIGVTGDLPPMDYVAANGKAAGFNIALLAEIANRAKVNIELVQIETGARSMALYSSKVDAVFWTKGVICNVCNSKSVEKIDGIIATESYFSDNAASITLKSEK